MIDIYFILGLLNEYYIMNITILLFWYEEIEIESHKK